MNNYSFTGLELVLLVALIGLGVYVVLESLVLAPRRTLTGSKAPAPAATRVAQWALFVLVARLVYRMIRSSALDFSLALVVIGAIAGVIWAVDSWVLKPWRLRLAARHGKPESEALAQPAAAEYAQSFFPIILIVLIIRSFLLEPFRIPSDSMMPTLLDGDFIFVNKYAYGLRLPVINKKVVEIGEPERGDVVVFRLPSNPNINYIKRLVGLPGDHVVVNRNRITVNGQLMPVEVDGFYSDEHGYNNEQLATEQLGDVRHTVMFTRGPYTDFEAIVPAGHYFFMGDNRNNSSDSRFRQVGFVPEDHLVGRAVRIWMNWRAWEAPKWDRIGTKIE